MSRVRHPGILEAEFGQQVDRDVRWVSGFPH